MSNSKTIKMGVIGAGYLGEFHIQQLQTLDNVEVVGFYDTDLERSNIISDKYHVKYFNNIEELSGQSNGIVIATPTFTHHTIAIKVLNNNCHVFIEKPITQTIAEVDELINLAKKNKLFIQVGHIERFNPAFLALTKKEINPQFIEVHRLASFKSRGNDTSVILDLMIHDIDIILNIIKSDIQDIQANGVKVITNDIDIANARITFENGCIANLTSSRISLKEMRKMRIFQENSYINIDFLNKILEEYSLTNKNKKNTTNNIQVFPYDDEKNQFILYKKDDNSNHNALQEELKYFVDSIIKNQAPMISGEVGREALSIALNIQEKINGKQ